MDTQIKNLNLPIDCACVLHGDLYSWDYVDKLYNMLNRHLTRPVNLHVYTEESRTVPTHMIKHSLIDWGIGGAKKAWWYKMQLFNNEHHNGPLLYFDLDTVITNNIDWIWQLSTKHFWSVRDFKYLWRPSNYSVNSSVMWWDTNRYKYIWAETVRRKLTDLLVRYHGDQDFITELIPQGERHSFNTDWVQSWRWQALDGGYNFKRRIYLQPDSGTTIAKNTSILVFHGNPKPSDIQDPAVLAHWR